MALEARPLSKRMEVHHASDGSCHGEPEAVTISLTPIDSTRRMKLFPTMLPRSRQRYLLARGCLIRPAIEIPMRECRYGLSPCERLTMQYWKIGLAGAAVVAAVAAGFFVTRPDDGQLTATVYKTPT